MRGCIFNRERREELRGFTREERRIDRVHMPTQALHHLRSVYTVATPADHRAVVAQLGAVEDYGDRPRFCFPLELLEDPAALRRCRRSCRQLHAQTQRLGGTACGCCFGMRQ